MSAVIITMPEYRGHIPIEVRRVRGSVPEPSGWKVAVFLDGYRQWSMDGFYRESDARTAAAEWIAAHLDEKHWPDNGGNR